MVTYKVIGRTHPNSNAKQKVTVKYFTKEDEAWKYITKNGPVKDSKDSEYDELDFFNHFGSKNFLVLYGIVDGVDIQYKVSVLNI